MLIHLPNFHFISHRRRGWWKLMFGSRKTTLFSQSTLIHNTNNYLNFKKDDSNDSKLKTISMISIREKTKSYPNDPNSIMEKLRRSITIAAVNKQIN